MHSTREHFVIVYWCTNYCYVFGDLLFDLYKFNKWSDMMLKNCQNGEN